jgi:hypothetical protein
MGFHSSQGKARKLKYLTTAYVTVTQISENSERNLYRNKNMKREKAWKMLVILLSIALMGSIVLYQTKATTPSSGFYYLSVPSSTWSYEIGLFDNGTYYMQNGSNWHVDFQSTNASAVLNNALGNLTNTGGEVFLKVANYTCDSTINFTMTANHSIRIEGEAKAVNITSTASTILYVNNGGWLSNSILTIENIKFYMVSATPICGLNLTYVDAASINNVAVTNLGTQTDTCVGIFLGVPNLTAGWGANNAADTTWQSDSATYWGVNFYLSIDHLMLIDPVSSNAKGISYEFRGGLHDYILNPHVYIGTGLNASSYGYYFYGVGLGYVLSNAFYENHTVMSTPIFYIASFVTSEPIIEGYSSETPVQVSNLPADITFVGCYYPSSLGTYFISTDNAGNYFGTNMTTGLIDSVNTNVTTLYNNAAQSLSSNGGGEITYGSGTFTFSGQAILYPRVSVKGQGENATIFVPSASASFSCLIGTLSGWNNVTLISISGIGLNGAGTTVADGLNVTVGMSQFSNLLALHFGNAGLSVYTIPSTYVHLTQIVEPQTHIIDCEAYYNGKNGIFLSGSDSYIDSCVTSANVVGFNITGFNIRVTNCHSFSENVTGGTGYACAGNYNSFLSDEAESGAVPTWENIGFFFGAGSTNDFNALEDCYVHNVGRALDFTSSGATTNILQIIGLRANQTSSYPIVIEATAVITTLQISGYSSAGNGTNYDLRNYGTISRLVFGTCSFSGTYPYYNTGTITNTYYPSNTTSTFIRTKNSGIGTFSGTGSQVQFTIPHGLGVVPTSYSVTSTNVNDSSNYYVTADATNLYINYIAPLAGLTPTASGWGTAPTNLANICDGDWTTATTAGQSNKTSANSSLGNITIDLGSIQTVDLMAKLGVWDNISTGVNVKWQWSSDGTTWITDAQGAGYLGASSQTLFYPFTIGITARYVGLLFQNSGANESANVVIYEIGAVGEMAPPPGTNNLSFSWAATYTP